MKTRRKAIRGHTNKYADKSKFKHGPYGYREDDADVQKINKRRPYNRIVK